MPMRLLMVAGLLAVVMFSAVACRDINRIVAGRPLHCEQTQQDLCNRVADVAETWLRDSKAPPTTGVTVTPRTCDAKEIGDTRCWWVNTTFQDSEGEGESDVQVHQHADGTLGLHHTSNGAPPDT